MLSKADILAAQDLKTVDIPVPEWGGTVRLKAMTGTARDAFENSLYSGEGKDRKQDLTNIRAKLLAVTLVDEEGNRLFSDSEVVTLGNKSANALSLCFDAAQTLNGMSAAAKDELGNVSSGDQSAGSISGSPLPLDAP